MSRDQSQTSEIRRSRATYLCHPHNPRLILVAEIFEIRGHTEVAAAHKLNNGLQVVLLFSGDANLPVLQLALHFEPLRLDRLNDLLRFVSFKPLLDF